MANVLEYQATRLKFETKIGRFPDWKQVMIDSYASLCPRGFGRTSYHLVETLQQGLVPVHVYSDVPWVPYADLYTEVGFSTNLQGMPQLLEQLKALSPETWARMENRAVELRESHFTTQGVMDQIQRFMQPGGDRTSRSDLRCQALPETIRDISFLCTEDVCRHRKLPENSDLAAPKKRRLRPPTKNGEPRCYPDKHWWDV